MSEIRNGFLLTHEDTSTAFAIILHNVRTYRSGGVVAVVHGKRNAESTLKDFQEGQSPSDHHAGWRYFLEKSDMAAGTDPAEATRDHIDATCSQSRSGTRELHRLDGLHEAIMAAIRDSLVAWLRRYLRRNESGELVAHAPLIDSGRGGH